jgi:hypothetical protein
MFFHEGPKFFGALHSAIRAAEHFILIEYFLIRADRTGKALAAELADAAKRGVRVLLIYDYIGSIETPASFFRSMSQQGIEITTFNIPSFKRGLQFRRDPDRDPLFYPRSPRDSRLAEGCTARRTREPTAAVALRHAAGPASWTQLLQHTSSRGNRDLRN